MAWLLIVLVVNIEGGVLSVERAFSQESECVQARAIYKSLDRGYTRVSAECIKITIR